MLGLRRLTAFFNRATTPVGRFVGLAHASGLVAKEELQRACNDFESVAGPSGTDPGSVEAFCEFLVAREIFTPWQCEKLKEGRYKGFFVACHTRYRILSWVRTEEEYTVYLVEDTQTKAHLHMRVTPPSRLPGDTGKFQIEELVPVWHERG